MTLTRRGLLARVLGVWGFSLFGKEVHSDAAEVVWRTPDWTNMHFQGGVIYRYNPDGTVEHLAYWTPGDEIGTHQSQGGRVGSVDCGATR